MIAPLRAIVLPLAREDTAAPLQVVVAEDVTLSPLGSESVRLVCVRSNAFEFSSVRVNVAATVTPTLVGANASDTVGAVTVAGIEAGQPLLPADFGALLVALVELTVIVAVSVLPWESVTMRVNVPVPVVVTLALVAPERTLRPPLAVHA